MKVESKQQVKGFPLNGFYKQVLHAAGLQVLHVYRSTLTIPLKWCL